MMVFAAVSLLAGITNAGYAATPDKDAKSVVATVNGAKIYRQDYERELRGAKQYFAAQGDPSVTVDDIKKAVVDKLVNSALLSEKSIKKGVKVDPADVDSEYQGFKSRFPDDEQYNVALKELALTDAEIKAKIEQSLTVEKFVNQEFFEKTTVTDQETKDYYENNLTAFQTPEQVRASHILIIVKEDADDSTKKEARKKLERIRKKIIAGGDFAKFAEKNSDCPSKSKGGDLGYFSRGQMVKPFETVAFSMMPGDVSDIVETQFGYHIIKSMDKKHSETIGYDEARTRIENYLRQVKSQTALTDFLKKAREASKISISIPVD